MSFTCPPGTPLIAECCNIVGLAAGATRPTAPTANDPRCARSLRLARLAFGHTPARGRRGLPGRRERAEPQGPCLRVIGFGTRRSGRHERGAMSSAADEVAGVVRAINDAWTHGRTEELHRLVRPDVVQALPILRDRVTGAEAYVRGYNEFLASSVVHEFAAEEPVVDVFGSTAVATCSYAIEYEHGGRRWRGCTTRECRASDRRPAGSGSP